MTTPVSPKILLVDDDPSILHAMTARLKHIGLDVAAKSDAMSAIAEANDVRPDIAIIDVNLPGTNGFDLARKLDEMFVDDHRIKKIFLTASKNPDLKREATSLDAVGFLEKPYSSNDLLAALENCYA
ncbi:MAG: response regulator [Pseudomonadales bacterium]